MCTLSFMLPDFLTSSMTSIMPASATGNGLTFVTDHDKKVTFLIEAHLVLRGRMLLSDGLVRT